MFGSPLSSPQSESSEFIPRSPYGAAKLFAHNLVRIYREHHGLFACSAILFNHESPLRTEAFVTRKITAHAARIKFGLADRLPLGDLDARRDWGFAGDYMNALRLMLSHDSPTDYVVATGETHSVRELCEIAFSYLGMDYRDYVVSSEQSWRAKEPVQLVGNNHKIRETLGWEPKTKFRDLIHLMVDHDLSLLRASAS